MIRLGVFGLALLLGFGGFGCASYPWQSKSTMSDGDGQEMVEPPVLPEQGLPMATELRFADVPVPAGAREDLERTYVYESKTLQIGRMVYTVKASVQEIAQFYIKECPASDWKLESVLEAAGAELFFRKPSKELRVTIRDLGVGRAGSMLVLHLTPTESASPSL